MAELNTLSLLNDANLVAYWRLEGNSNDSKGTLHGTATSVTFGLDYGKFIQGGLFTTASSSRISVADPATLEFTGNFTISIWFNRSTNAATNLRLISKGADGTNPGFAIWGSNTFIVTAIQGTAARTLSAELTHLGTGVWQHVALVRSGTSQLSYLNGVLVDTVTASSGSTAGTANFLIGNLDSNNALAWSGSLDDISIFNRALTAGEVSSLFSIQGALFFSQL